MHVPIKNHKDVCAVIREEQIDVGRDKTGTEHALRVISFGVPGSGPKVYIQAGLHADELPGLLVARLLVEALSARAAAGDVEGEIVIIPSANPIGLKQVEGGYMQGRVECGSDRNFNRGFPDLGALVRAKVEAQLGDDPKKNIAVIRKAMGKALRKIEPADCFDHVQLTLMRHAYDADIVLDLHADNEAMLHVYIGEASWPGAVDLAAELDARAVLLCDDSGGGPFDEACSGPWAMLARAFPDKPIPAACLAATVELRSNNAVNRELADRDVRAIMRFLMRRGVLKGEAGALPRLLAEPASLRAMQQIKSPIEGVVDYRLKLGDRVRKGDVIAHIIPLQGGIVEVEAGTDGLLFARHDQTWAWPGKVIGKIAGTALLQERRGNLLSP